MDTIKRIGTFAGLLALILTLTFGLSSGERVYAQDNADCANNPDATELVVRGLGVDNGNTVAGPTLVVVREVKASTINVYAKCLAKGESLTAKQGFDIWSGYPNEPYAQHDACLQAVADRNASNTTGSWASGKTVTLDGKPIPASCGSTSDPIRSTDDKQVVPKGTIVLQVAVDFTHQREDVRALVLEEGTATVFTEAYRLMQFTGYESLEAAQNDICGQVANDLRTAGTPNGWNEGFSITVNNGQPNNCPAS